MPDYCVTFQVKTEHEMQIPDHLLEEGGKYLLKQEGPDVYVWGNTLGLLYLAEILIRCAKGGYAQGFHVHLPADRRAPVDIAEQAQRAELVLFAATENLD